MYNLLVTADFGAWNRHRYELDRSRFLEYTSDVVAERFKSLNSKQIDSLLQLPALFAYEGKTEPMRVGRLTSIKALGRKLVVEFVLDDDIPELPYDSIEPIRVDLDIREWELNRTHWAIKDEKLFELLRSENLLPARTPEPPGEQEPLPPVDEAFVTVGSVSEFIETVLGLNHGTKQVFYRGHPNKLYRLEPSVFRRDKDGNFIYRDTEDTLYRELLVSNSIDFQGDTYTLDRLVRMQHYSLPTRLLDITSNPLIALYFACKSNSASASTSAGEVADTPAEVIVFAMNQGNVKYFDSDTASCIANLARLPKEDKEKIDYDTENDEAFNAQAAIRRLLHFVKEEKPFFEPRIKRDDLRSVICIKSKRTNDRIAFQSGAFLLFGQDAVLDELGTSDIAVTRISIANKSQILQQLDQLNINESTVFPYIENSARYVAQKYSFRKKSQ